MNAQQTRSIEELVEELEQLRQQVARYRELEEQMRDAELRLREKEAFNFALFNFSPMVTIVVDRDGRVIRSNRAKLRSGDRLPNIGDIMYRDYAAEHSIDMYAELMACIASGKPRHFPELKYQNKYLAVTLSPFPHGAIIVSQDITENKQMETDRTLLIDNLRKALSEVENLRSLLPICAHCKRIRDTSGLWHAIESYISSHSTIDFSHTMCPECAQAFYPELYSKLRARENSGG